jgi:hypothetical protein
MLTLHPQGHRRGSSSTSLSGCASDSHHSSVLPHPFYTSPSMARHKSSSTNPKSSSRRSSTLDEKVVAQALERARETDEGAHDPQVRKILEEALSRIWDKIQAQPDSYVMSRTEMSVFTYYQYSFTGNELAVAARKRYWDHIHA